MTQQKWLFRTISVFLLTAAFAFPLFAQCDIGSWGYQRDFRSGNTAVGNLADYGLIFEDAKKRNCSIGTVGADGVKQGAYRALIDKINSTFAYNNPTNDPTGGWHTDHFGRTVKPFQGAFEGGHVALIFASALMIGGHGDNDNALDAALIRVRDSYRYTKNPNCGFYQPNGWKNGGDTCMEEHALAATGFAWIAAYEIKRRGPTTSDPFYNQASLLINDALSTYDSICLNDPLLPTDANTRGPCNVHTNDAPTLWDKLVQDSVTKKTKAYPLSFNREQNMTYGPGQLTIISAALIGLEEAGRTKTLTSSQQVIAAALLEEAQRKAEPLNGNYFYGSADAPALSGTCAHADVSGGVVVRDDNRRCAEGAVRPKIWNLTQKGSTGYSSFFERYVPNWPVRASVHDQRFVNGQTIDTPIAQAYQFNQYVNHFTKDTNNTDLNWGRESFYHVLGFRWHTLDPNRNVNDVFVPSGNNKRPRLIAHLDNFNPGGYMDNMDASGVARGWACDADRPFETVRVDFKVGNTVAVRAWANQPSEAAVNNLCGGGTAHRFVVQMPAWTKGQPITAWGQDVTWRGETLLVGYYCPNNPACVW